jgi:hypothetical protein
MYTVLEILKYTIPSIITLLTSYLIVQKFLITHLKKKQIALLHETQQVIIRMRLQAYERLVLYIERIHPRSLVTRIYQTDMTVSDLQQMLTFTIKSEFDHNLSQQLYVSKQVWETVRSVKEQEINMINHIAKLLNADAPAKELHMRIVDYVLTTEGELPTEVALHIINEEAKRVLSYGPEA